MRSVQEVCNFNAVFMSHVLLSNRSFRKIKLRPAWFFACVVNGTISWGLAIPGARANEPISPAPLPGSELDLPPEVIEDSPVLQRWLEEVPDVRSEIRHDPSFRTRVRLGYSELDQADGFYLGVEDVFVGETPLTVSADYQHNGDRESYGVDLHYYALPLGSYVNLAPIVGYRHVELDDFSQDGVNLGLQVRIVPSRTSGADLTLSQTWVAPLSDSRVSLTEVGLGYAVTQQLRISTDLQWQSSPQQSDRRIGIGLEWMP